MRRVKSTTIVMGLLCVALGACGGGKKDAREPVAAVTHEDGPAPGTPPAATGPLTEEECTRLFDHVAELMQKDMPPDEWAAGKDDLAAQRGEMIQGCVGGDLARTQFDCVMRATTIRAFPDCVPAQ
jgi:hypothetical protein